MALLRPPPYLGTPVQAYRTTNAGSLTVPPRSPASAGRVGSRSATVRNQSWDSPPRGRLQAVSIRSPGAPIYDGPLPRAPVVTPRSASPSLNLSLRPVGSQVQTARGGPAREGVSDFRVIRPLPSRSVIVAPPRILSARGLNPTSSVEVLGAGSSSPIHMNMSIGSNVTLPPTTSHLVPSYATLAMAPAVSSGQLPMPGSRGSSPARVQKAIELASSERVQALEQEVAQLKKFMQEPRDNLQRRVDELEQSNASVLQERDMLAKEVDKLEQARANDLKRGIAEREAVLERVRQLEAAARDNDVAHHDSQSKLKQESSEKKRLQGEIERLQAEVRKLQAEVNRLEGVHVKKQSDSKEHESLVAELNQFKARLKSKEKEEQGRVEHVRQLAIERDELRVTLEQKRKEEQRRVEQSRQIAGERDDLRATLEQQRRLIDDLDAQLHLEQQFATPSQFFKAIDHSVQLEALLTELSKKDCDLVMAQTEIRRLRRSSGQRGGA